MSTSHSSLNRLPKIHSIASVWTSPLLVKSRQLIVYKCGRWWLVWLRQSSQVEECLQVWQTRLAPRLKYYCFFYSAFSSNSKTNPTLSRIYLSRLALNLCFLYGVEGFLPRGHEFHDFYAKTGFHDSEIPRKMDFRDQSFMVLTVLSIKSIAKLN